MRRRPTCKEGFLPFAEAKAFMKDKGIKTSIGYKLWAFSSKRPSNIPVAPESVFADEWKGWNDYLGKEKIEKGRKRRPPKDTPFMTFNEAREFALKLNLRTVNEFKVWAATEQRPITFPSNPDIFYKEEFKGYRDFLGNKAPEFMALEEYKVIILPMEFRTESEFREWAKSPKRPLNAPSNPDKFYKKEWKGWRAFLLNL